MTGATGETYAYGDAPEQAGDLWLPGPDFDPPWPTVVLVHGGFWARRYERSLMDGLASDLTGRGYAAWNVEYRRARSPGGGWPATFDDVRAAVDHLVALDEGRLDLDRVTLVGHSVGATMCLWVAARNASSSGRSAGSGVTPRLVICQAGVLDLDRAARLGVGEGAVVVLLGSPDENQDRYEAASPVARVPIGVRTVLVHGESDALVPPSQSRRYADVASAAGDGVELVVLPDADHFDHLDPDSVAWDAVVDRLPRPATDR